jgi:hypothetical protein
MAPAPPSNLGATITGGNTANLTWSDNSSNETQFKVERKLEAPAEEADELLNDVMIESERLNQMLGDISGTNK